MCFRTHPKFLGFQTSLSMTVTLPEAKQVKIANRCNQNLESPAITKLALAATIGQLQAATLAVYLGPLHFRELQ